MNEATETETEPRTGRDENVKEQAGKTYKSSEKRRDSDFTNIGLKKPR